MAEQFNTSLSEINIKLLFNNELKKLKKKSRQRHELKLYKHLGVLHKFKIFIPKYRTRMYLTELQSVSDMLIRVDGKYT